MNYKIIYDEQQLDDFINWLPDLGKDEVYYLSLFSRRKYVTEINDSQLSRFVSRKEHLKEKISRLECPIGGFQRDGKPILQESLVLYISLNPRSLVKANKNLLIELAKRCADGDINFNPVSEATNQIHVAMGRKIFLDFDFDFVDVLEFLPRIDFLPIDSYRILVTHGGFHLILSLEKLKKISLDWYTKINSLPGCDAKGANGLIPVVGCTQGGFIPYWWH